MAQPPASIFDHLTAPACAVHLGWQLLEIDPAKGSIKVQFAPKPEFLNPAGYVQGGFIVAMMDDTMGPAVLAHTEGRKLTSSIDIHAHFLRPVRLGPVVVDAHVTRLGQQVAFIEAKLYDHQGKLCARATSSASLSAYDPDKVN
jgi:uncharacterized protein (TIGR00369 family)